MDLHKTMSGDQYLCDNYNLCGQRIPVEKITKGETQEQQQ